MSDKKRVNVNGLDFAVVDEGEGQPVLLLHGFPDSSHLWRNQIPVLVDAGFRAIAPDLRGMGDTQAPSEMTDYQMHHHLADVAGILDVLDLPTAHVVGHDWGAAIAWYVATFSPERVDRLVALSVGRFASTALDLEQVLRLGYMFIFQAPEAEAYFSKDDFANLRMMVASSPDADRSIEDLSRPGAFTAALNYYRANAQPSLLLGEGIELPNVKADTMGVWGDRDIALAERQMSEAANYIDGAFRYERLEGVGHWIPTEAPERLNPLLVDFLR